jgi:hypothetical protein
VRGVRERTASQNPGLVGLPTMLDQPLSSRFVVTPISALVSQHRVRSFGVALSERADHARVRWIRRPVHRCVLVRGRALPGQDPSLPYEVHLIWFPDRDALNSYMEDPRRHALLAAFGDVFTSKQAVEVELRGETSLI